nr:hypothetical protein 29 [Paracoccaceae bacterium]
MTTANLTENTAAIVAELGGSSQQTVDIMIGVGLVKDSEAVFFQYEGDEKVSALMQASGRPVTRIGNVRLSGLSIADDVYADAGFSGSKLNIFVETQSGRSVMLTSGLTTIWSQCLMTSLMGLVTDNAIDHLISIDTWKGNSKMKPCFAAVRDGQRKVTNNEMYQSLMDARSDRDRAKTEAIMRDAVDVLNAALGQTSVQKAEVTIDPAAAELF